MVDKSARARARERLYTKRLQFFAGIPPLRYDRDLAFLPCMCARTYVYARDDTATGPGREEREHITVGNGVGEATVWGGGVAGLPGGWSTRRCVQPNNL